MMMKGVERTIRERPDVRVGAILGLILECADHLFRNCVGRDAVGAFGDVPFYPHDCYS